LTLTKNIKINNNIINTNGAAGIDGGMNNNLVISYNDISFNSIGIDLFFSNRNIILCNNIRNNSVYFMRGLTYAWYFKLMWLSDDIPLVTNNFMKYLGIPGPNFWFRNYWGEPSVFPKIIPGSYLLFCLSISTGKNLLLPLINFDWHPAKEPYDIPGMH
jgi:hypothetical protein